MRIAAVLDGHIHYDLTGPEEAPALVLVNSLGTDFRLWDALLPHLEGPWRILRYDFRGHGLSSPAAIPWTIDAHAADLEALMTGLGIGPAAIFGVSVGGQIALALSARAPALVRGMILADTGARIGDHAIWSGRIAQVENEGLPAMADSILERWFPQDWRRAHPAETELWRAMVSRQAPEGYVATSTALRASDLTDTCRRVGVPTLCVAGLEDKATPPDLVRALADLVPGAALAEIAGAGHLPMVDKPAELAAAVNPFLAGLR